MNAENILVNHERAVKEKKEIFDSVFNIIEKIGIEKYNKTSKRYKILNPYDGYVSRYSLVDTKCNRLFKRKEFFILYDTNRIEYFNKCIRNSGQEEKLNEFLYEAEIFVSEEIKRIREKTEKIRSDNIALKDSLYAIKKQYDEIIAPTGGRGGV